MTDVAQPYIDAAIAAVKDQNLTPQHAADVIADQCNQCIADPRQQNEDPSNAGDLPGLETFLWFFWTKFVQLACQDANTHDRLAQIMVALKSKGNQGCEHWRIWGASAKWEDLPLFGPVSREEMNGTSYYSGCGFAQLMQ